jgi:hypothetical protein
MQERSCNRNGSDFTWKGRLLPLSASIGLLFDCSLEGFLKFCKY